MVFGDDLVSQNHCTGALYALHPLCFIAPELGLRVRQPYVHHILCDLCTSRLSQELCGTSERTTKNVSSCILQISEAEVTHPASTRMLRTCFQQLVYCTQHRDLCHITLTSESELTFGVLSW
jgi:hypothetical protein